MTNQEPTKKKVVERTLAAAPVVIMVEPSLPENVGMAARAMLNFGLKEMRLVRPQFSWPNANAINASSGAHSVLENALHYEDTEVAVHGLHRLAATTARTRDMIKDVQSPREWGADFRDAIETHGQRAGILFGPERAGLNNNDVALADTLVSVPTNPAFSSINLAQTILLLGYEWILTGVEVKSKNRIERKGHGAELALLEEVLAFYEHLENELDKAGFLRVQEKRPRMIRNIRNIFNRAKLTKQEVRTLRGIIVALSREKWQPIAKNRCKEKRNEERTI